MDSTISSAYWNSLMVLAAWPGFISEEIPPPLSAKTVREGEVKITNKSTWIEVNAHSMFKLGQNTCTKCPAVSCGQERRGRMHCRCSCCTLLDQFNRMGAKPSGRQTLDCQTSKSFGLKFSSFYEPSLCRR
jgi:hypothetical protein